MAKDKVRWRVIRGVCSTQGAEGAQVYGVRAENADGIAWEWADVSASLQVVTVLAERLNEEQPEPCHFAEIVADYIEEQSIGAL